jgi:Zn-dependent protease
MGRLTMNPFSHLDPIGTIMLFLVHFGWARPVPVNPLNLRNPKKDILWVSLAGPASNLILAAIFGIVLRIIGPGFIRGIDLSFLGLLRLMIIYGVIINLALCIFNLIPIPPLDGSKILKSLLPLELEYKYEEYERYGPLILIGLVLLGAYARIPILWMIISPFISIFSYIFTGYNLIYYF